MRPSFRVFGFIAALLLALLAGCERSDRLPFAAEDADPNFTRGKQLVRQGRSAEALSAFLKVIATRGDNAPESHLEAAVIYRQHIKDPIAAIYHFRKYLELQGNSRQAELVRQHIDAAKREFARTLPAHPLEDASVKLAYQDQLERLQRENEALKAELVALRSGLPSPSANPPVTRGGFDLSGGAPPAGTVAPLPRPVPVDASPSGDSRPNLGGTNVAAEPTVRPTLDPSGRMGTGGTATLHAPAARSTPAAPPAAPAATGKKHVVQAGDTLYALSQRYYGTRTRWREIFQANRDQLKSESDRLRVGQELKIP